MNNKRMRSRLLIDSGSGLSHRLKVYHHVLEVVTLQPWSEHLFCILEATITDHRKTATFIWMIHTFLIWILQDGSSQKFKELPQLQDLATQHCWLGQELSYLEAKVVRTRLSKTYMLWILSLWPGIRDLLVRELLMLDLTIHQILLEELKCMFLEDKTVRIISTMFVFWI